MRNPESLNPPLVVFSFRIPKTQFKLCLEIKDFRKVMKNNMVQMMIFVILGLELVIQLILNSPVYAQHTSSSSINTLPMNGNYDSSGITIYCAEYKSTEEREKETEENTPNLEKEIDRIQKAIPQFFARRPPNARPKPEPLTLDQQINVLTEGLKNPLQPADRTKLEERLASYKRLKKIMDTKDPKEALELINEHNEKEVERLAKEIKDKAKQYSLRKPFTDPEGTAQDLKELNNVIAQLESYKRMRDSTREVLKAVKEGKDAAPGSVQIILRH